MDSTFEPTPAAGSSRAGGLAAAAVAQADAAAAAEARAWAGFAEPGSSAEFHERWLALLALQVGGVQAALLLVSEEAADGGAQTFAAGAVWPDPARDLAYLAPVAEQALSERRGVVRHAAEGGPGARVAYPLEMAGVLKAAVVLDLVPRSEAALQRALRQLHWASAWLLDRFRREALLASRATVARLALVQQALGVALQQREYRAAVHSALNHLAAEMGCERVSLGRVQGDAGGGHVRLEAISHTATFERRGNLARAIAEAMDEALDAGMLLAWPAEGDARLLAPSQAALRRIDAQDDDADDAGASVVGDLASRGGGVMSVPLPASAEDAEQGRRHFGVLCFERRRGAAFDAGEQETARVAALLLGPVFSLAHAQSRPLPQHLVHSARRALVALVGPAHPGAKLVAASAAVLLAVLLFAHGEHRVTARTVVEGEVQRAAVVPFDGFLAESMARAGDTVRAGQPLARLDDRDLQLEAARWRAEHEQALGKLRVAQAAYDRAAAAVLGAQAAQAEAQRQLVDERLSRLVLRAPFDGVVVSGDLRQLVGTPLSQGKVLFEVAPLATYRVVLQVDERDIGRVRDGQAGQLVLAGLPGRELGFVVHQITPVAETSDGRNVFRVEARIDAAGQQAASSLLKPGMEGVGKVVVGRERLLWIWTHRFVEWLQLALWRWMP